ncbi:HesB-like protein [Clostridium tarantellae]|uniref:HesB-like protein n=1 Tax=Clostridium tarantellae TaxID=39493 RepID=A0A6I1MP96_9CLOT|nr:HesB-like protein [Clostridium tarantellae]MPQ45346.1 HesB-like protein [Clostridium tarantellae]
MNKITMSKEAYTEFKNFLDENNITDLNIRINLAGYGCSGPAFNITIDNENEEDIVEKFEDIKFIMTPNLIDTFGGFMILSTEENEGRGLTLKPLVESMENNCGGCGGSCGCSH